MFGHTARGDVRAEHVDLVITQRGFDLFSNHCVIERGVDAVFGFETQSSFSVRLQTDDGAGGTFEEAFTITVNDLNEAPTDIALDNASVAENLAAGTLVGTLTSADPDAGATFSYALVAGAGDTDNASFAIVGDQLQTAAVLERPDPSTP